MKAQAEKCALLPSPVLVPPAEEKRGPDQDILILTACLSSQSERGLHPADPHYNTMATAFQITQSTFAGNIS
ncbi:Y-linked testis-specific protein 1 [Clarias magur]|uniref:Y-linked testis-specific protein 1 n=1 Tax=Clarias magur TaxID=1594786 RepID=A0A8J4UMP9_CLAMG|nr:Y-linked testis-specific protein 1 [Clarias magur]